MQRGAPAKAATVTAQTADGALGLRRPVGPQIRAARLAAGRQNFRVFTAPDLRLLSRRTLPRPAGLLEGQTPR